MLNVKGIKSRIDLINRRLKSLSATRDPAINHVLKNAGMNGGKRIRGVIVLLTASACGCKDMKKALDLACAVEITHHATLIHDDIVDNSKNRRGGLTLNRKVGGALSVLTGDYFFSRSLDLIIQDDDYDLFRVFATAIRDACEGEIQEIY
ncbi:MAG: polyprenyl synthetase family protein, partial [Spirochaetia bacterium]|nr:polyprenyl synthetase family protein [Spirochaetia bacterium]